MRLGDTHAQSEVASEDSAGAGNWDSLGTPGRS